MPPKTQPSTNSSANLNWTRAMDDALIDAFLHEYHEGNKVNGNFTSKAYGNIVKELSALFGEKIDKEKVKNRWKTVKRNFAEVYDIFKSGMSGFAWNPSTHLWEAEPEVWDALIESKPKAAFWRNIPLPNYQKMVTIYGNDRATGDDAETPSEIRKRQHSTIEKDFDSIDELDKLMSQNEVILENNDTFVDFASDNLDDLTTLERHAEYHSHGATSGSKNKKQKMSSNKEKVNEIKEIRGGLQDVANAIEHGNAIMEKTMNIMEKKVNRKFCALSGEETWKLIKECGVETKYWAQIYCFLMNNPDQLRAIIECPLEARKLVIMHMVFGSSNAPFN